MTVPVPPLTDRPAGTRQTAETYRQDVTSTTTFLAKPPIFQGYQSAAQSIPSTSLTTIAIDTTLVDTYLGHSNTVNNGRYTCSSSAPGWYQITVSLGFTANATGSRLIEIHKNGTAVKLVQTGNDSSRTDIGACLQSTAYVLLSAGDYLEGFAYQSTAGALSTNPNNTGMTVIWIHA